MEDAVKRYAWIGLVALLGCGPVNNASRNAHPFTVVKTGVDGIIVRIEADATKGPTTAQCYAIHMEYDYGGYVAYSARLPKGACE